MSPLSNRAQEWNPGPSRGSPLRYRCATQAPPIVKKKLDMMYLIIIKVFT